MKRVLFKFMKEDLLSLEDRVLDLERRIRVLEVNCVGLRSPKKFLRQDDEREEKGDR